MTNAITYVTFKINQDKIVKTLCIMRKAQNNTCNGSCVLNAKIKELNNLEKKHSTSITEKNEVIYVIENVNYNIEKPSYFSKKQIYTFLVSKNPIATSLVQLRPPIC